SSEYTTLLCSTLYRTLRSTLFPYTTLFRSLLGRSYPAEDFDRAWKRLLFDDFHDIFPGSGIAVNYLDAKRNLEDVGRVGNAILSGSLEAIAARINSQGPGVPVVVFNSLAWPRTEVIEAEAQLPAAARQIEVVDAAGKPVPSQLLHMDAETHRAHLLLQAVALDRK